MELVLTRFGGPSEDGFGGVTWGDFEWRIRLSSGGRWSRWCALGGRRRSIRQEFEPTAQSIWTWARQTEWDAGKRADGPSSDEREELTKFRRENARLRQERDILAKGEADQKGIQWMAFPPNAWFARERKATTSGFTGS
jgi:transposase